MNINCQANYFTSKYTQKTTNSQTEAMNIHKNIKTNQLSRNQRILKLPNNATQSFLGKQHENTKNVNANMVCDKHDNCA